MGFFNDLIQSLTEPQEAAVPEHEMSPLGGSVNARRETETVAGFCSALRLRLLVDFEGVQVPGKPHTDERRRRFEAMAAAVAQAWANADPEDLLSPLVTTWRPMPVLVDVRRGRAVASAAEIDIDRRDIYVNQIRVDLGVYRRTGDGRLNEVVNEWPGGKPRAGFPLSRLDPAFADSTISFTYQVGVSSGWARNYSKVVTAAEDRENMERARDLDLDELPPSEEQVKARELQAMSFLMWLDGLLEEKEKLEREAGGATANAERFSMLRAKTREQMLKLQQPPPPPPPTAREIAERDVLAWAGIRVEEAGEPVTDALRAEVARELLSKFAGNSDKVNALQDAATYYERQSRV